jgi:hypothetical protein
MGYLQWKCTRTRCHGHTAPPPAPKCGNLHVSGIYVGSELSSMSFHPLRTLIPPILDSTEVIHMDYLQWKCTRTRCHGHTAPPLAPKCGNWHGSGIYVGSELSSMSFHPLRTLIPPILDITEVIYMGYMLWECTQTRCRGHTAPPLAPKLGNRHGSGMEVAWKWDLCRLGTVIHVNSPTQNSHSTHLG